jgi:carbamoyltransferase
MKILGINISHHFSICIYENGKVKDLWYEERYNLIKNWIMDNREGFILSIFKNIKFKPDLVMYSSYQRTTDGAITDLEIIELIQKQLDNPTYYFNKHNHHVYHALSAFYFSNLNEAMAVVVDGGGAQPLGNLYQEIQSIFYVDKKQILKLYQHLSNRKFMQVHKTVKNYSPHAYNFYLNGTEYVQSSVLLGGLEFNIACELMGFNDGGFSAGKLMGLSSYGYSNKKYDLNYEHVNLAKDTQEHFFSETCRLVEKTIKYEKTNNIVLSGGCFLNCSNNFKLVKKYPNINFFVDPIPHDGGTAIGACLYNDYR